MLLADRALVRWRVKRLLPLWQSGLFAASHRATETGSDGLRALYVEVMTALKALHNEFVKHAYSLSNWKNYYAEKLELVGGRQLGDGNMWQPADSWDAKVVKLNALRARYCMQPYRPQQSRSRKEAAGSAAAVSCRSEIRKPPNVHFVGSLEKR